MPYYTISTTTTQEEAGDNVTAGTIPASTTLVITPDAGYVLDAAGFSGASPLPTGIESVTFANSTTAFVVGNVVNVTVNFDDGSPNSNFVMPAADLSLNIGICESGGVQAVIPVVSVPIVAKFKLRTEEATWAGGTHTTTLTSSPYHSSTISTTSSTYAVGTGFSGANIFGLSTNYGSVGTTKIHTIVTTIDPSSGSHTIVQGTMRVCHADEDPNVAVLHAVTNAPNCLSYDPTGYICNITPELYSQFASLPNNFNGYIETLYYNADGYVNKFDWKIDFEGYTQAELNAVNYASSDLLANGVVTYGVSNTAVWPTQFTIDKFEDSATTLTDDGWDIPISDLGESRDLTVTGTPGATFSVTFVNASNATILASPITNVVMPSGGRYDWTQVFPSLGSGTTTYTLVVSAGTQTSLSTLFTARSPSSTFVYSQIGTIPNISLNGSSSNSFATSTTQSVSTTFAPNYRFGRTNNTFPVSMTITKVGGGNLSITRQPVWPGDWSNSDPNTNGGTDINLSNLTVTGSGTSTLTLSGTGSRSRIGTSNTVMSLALNNFINTTASNTPVTGISLNTSPVATSSFNIGDDINVNAVLTPSNPTTPTLAWTVSGSGFTLTPAADTQSCLVKSESTVGTRTVTATATDGSNVAGTINVTATQQTLETVNDTISVYSGRATVIDITANDTTHGGGCTVVIESDPEVGSLAVSGQTVTYTALDFAAQDTFTYKLTKSGLAASNTSTVTVLVGIN